MRKQFVVIGLRDIERFGLDYSHASTRIQGCNSTSPAQSNRITIPQLCYPDSIENGKATKI